MTVFKNIKHMNIDEFAEWFEKNCTHDENPCDVWWSKNYCDKCEPVVLYDEELGRKMKLCWCELHNKCKYFQDRNELLDKRQMIKIWLESEEEKL